MLKHQHELKSEDQKNDSVSSAETVKAGSSKTEAIVEDSARAEKEESKSGVAGSIESIELTSQAETVRTSDDQKTNESLEKSKVDATTTLSRDGIESDSEFKSGNAADKNYVELEHKQGVTSADDRVKYKSDEEQAQSTSSSAKETIFVTEPSQRLGVKSSLESQTDVLESKGEGSVGMDDRNFARNEFDNVTTSPSRFKIISCNDILSQYRTETKMGLTGCYAVLKYAVFLMNLIFWICGASVVVLSVWMLIDPTFKISMAQDEPSYYSGLCILFLAGALLFVVGFLGCFGAFTESTRLLILYFCGLLLILVAQISAGIWAYSNKDKLQNVLRHTVSTTLQFEYGKLDSQRTDSFDAIQHELQCCGANGPEDWSSSSWRGDENALKLSATTTLKSYEIPKSCCNPEYDANACDKAVLNFSTAPITSDVIFKEGCTDKLLKKLEEYMNIIILVTIVIGIIEFIGLIVTLILCCAIRAVTKYK